jgi:F-type H+-transporting ATPase subunit b
MTPFATLLPILQTAPTESSGGISSAFNSLGINLPVLIAFVINFALLLFLLNRFLYGPVLKMLDERRRRIEEGLNAADRAAQEAHDAEQRVQEEIRQAQIQGQEIVANAQQIAQRIQEDARRQAESDAAAFRERAQADMRSALDSARAELRREFADLTILAAGKVINQSLDPQQHVALINDVLTQASNGAAASNN